MTVPATLAADALLDLVLPFGRLVIGLLVLLTVLVSARRIASRGPSRMGGALLLIGGAVICVAVLGYLVQDL